MNSEKRYAVFVGKRLVAAGLLNDVLPELKKRFEEDRGTILLTFEDESGRQVDFDLRGTLNDVLERAGGKPEKTGPGRPRLGVTAREITLLPQQWEWLEMQPAGASAAIRRLVDEARKREPEKWRKLGGIHAAGRFLSAMAGNYPGYEEASRSIYADDRERFMDFASAWPPDVREYALRLWKGGA